MDKDVAKRLMRDAGLPVVPFITTTSLSRIDYAAAIAALGTTDCSVKPQYGIVVRCLARPVRTEFGVSCELAFRYDHKPYRTRPDGARRLNVLSWKNRQAQLRASERGEIVPASKHGFYSYQAKIIDADAPRYASAELPPHNPSASGACR